MFRAITKLTKCKQLKPSLYLNRLESIMTGSSTEYETKVDVSTKPIIAVDVDEVLGFFVERLVVWHNREYATSLTLNDMTSYEFHEVWGGTPDETRRKMKEFTSSDLFADIPIVPGAFHVLSSFTDNFSFEVVTARPNYLHEVTKEWLNRHYPGIFADVHTCNVYGLEKRRTKREVCEQIKAIALIDDNSKYILDCAPVLQKVIYFNFNNTYNWCLLPENHGHDNIVSCEQWSEVSEQFALLAKNNQTFITQ